jgi:S1-C subfamily serine protease
LATILVLLLTIAAAVWGLQRGAIGIVGTVAGVAVAMLVATPAAHWAADAIGGEPDRRAAVRVIVALLVLATGGAIGGIIGARLQIALPEPVRMLDGAIGAVFAVVGLALIAGVVATIAAQSGQPQVAGAVRDSPLLRRLATWAPAVAIYGNLQEALRTSDWPEVFADLSPTPSGAVPKDAPDTARVAGDARSATVKIKGRGCGGTIEGSGVVLAPGMVATNAHVVSGLGSVKVQPGGEGDSFEATPVLFDENNDVAMLRVPGLRVRPLRLVADTPRFGTAAAVLGYPGDGPYRATAAAVGAERTFDSRDIYDHPYHDRPILVLRARVRPGNSGGPVVVGGREVAGLVFAAALDDRNVSFAVPTRIVRDALAAARRVPPNEAVSTKSCSR